MIVYEMDYLTSEISETQFDAEGQITSAIDYVVNDASGMVYTLTGHSETDLPSNLTNRMSKAHIEIVSDSLNLLNDSIPEDCDLLICYNPTLDLADVELTTLQEYLEKGRDMMLVIDQAELENFNKLLNDYGLKMQSGFVGDQSTYYQQYYNSYEYFIFAPTVSEYSDVTSKITASTITMYAKGMLECTPVRSSIDVDAFLTTSKSGLLVNGEITSKNEFILGAASTEKISENETTRFTVFSTLYFCEDDLTMSFPNMANLDVVINAVAAHFPGIEGSAVSIPSKSLSVTYNTVENYGLWSIIFVGIIPVATIVGGLFFWVKRRKK